MVVRTLVVVGPPKYLSLVSSSKAPNNSLTFPLKVNGINVFRSFPSVLVTPEYMCKAFTHSLMISSVFVTQSIFRIAPAFVNRYACPGCGKRCLPPIHLVRVGS